MFEFYVDFDAVRERAIDAIFAGAGHVSEFVETVIDSVEQFVDDVNDAVQ